MKVLQILCVGLLILLLMLGCSGAGWVEGGRYVSGDFNY